MWISTVAGLDDVRSERLSIRMVAVRSELVTAAVTTWTVKGRVSSNSHDAKQPLLKLGAVASFHPHYSLFLARPAVDDASAHQQIVLMVVGGIGKSGEVVIDLNYPHRETRT
jgi:hypothetical protein